MTQAMEFNLFGRNSSLIPFVRCEGEGYFLSPEGEGADPFGGESYLLGEHLLAVQLEEGGSLKGRILLSAQYGILKEYNFEVKGESEWEISEEKFEENRRRYYQILVNQQIPGSAWFQAQSERGRKEGLPNPAASDQNNDWMRGGETFSVFSGGLAVAENLSLERTLQLGAEKEGELVPLADIEGVSVKPVDWEALLKKNKVPADLPIDSLADAIPEDQAAVFFQSLPAFVETLDWLNQGVGELGALKMRASVSQVLAFYEEQLGLQGLDQMAQSIPVQSVALTTSDPYLVSGTGLTLVFETEKPGFVYRALSLALRARAKAAQATKIEGEDFAEWKHLAFENPSREFSAHLLLLGDRIVITNSKSQVAAMVAVNKGTKESLGSLQEYRFFRNRYPLGDTSDGYLFLSDATIRRWVSPQARIGTARRMRAQGLLASLNAKKVLGAENLEKVVEASGEVLGELQWTEKGYQSSRYGSARFMHPVAELEFEQVTKAEAESYQAWREGYERGWTVFDPIAFRFSMSEKELRWDLSVLPLTLASEYRDIMAWLGSVKLDSADYQFSDDLFARFAMALDTEGEVFQEILLSDADMLGIEGKGLSWIGDSVVVSAYESPMWDVMNEDSDLGEFWSQLPVGIRIESKGSLRLAAFLVAFRSLVDESAPDSVKWEKMKEGEKSFVRVSAEDDDFEIYYATQPKALLVSLRKDTLLQMMAEEEERAQAPPREGTEIVPQLAAAANFRGDPQRVTAMKSLLGGGFFPQSLPSVAWPLLPLLNDLRQTLERNGNQGDNVLTVYEQIYGRSLQGQYHWNAEALTMEKVCRELSLETSGRRRERTSFRTMVDPIPAG